MGDKLSLQVFSLHAVIYAWHAIGLGVSWAKSFLGLREKLFAPAK